MKSLFPEFDQYITPDGEVFNFDGKYKFITSVSGQGMSPIKYLSQKGPFQHGETIYDYRLQKRIIQIAFEQSIKSRWDHWTVREELMNFFRPNRQVLNAFDPGILRKKLPTGNIRDLDVFIEIGPQFSATKDRNQFSIQDTIRFVAPNPTFYDPTQQSQVWTWAESNELVFPFTFENDIISFIESFLSKVETVTYEGTWLAYPSFTITGPTQGFTIENQTTDEVLEYLRLVGSGETITIILDYGNKSIESSVYGNVIGYLSSNSDLATFHLAPDPEAADGGNDIRILLPTGIDGTSLVTMNWYTRYIGI